MKELLVERTAIPDPNVTLIRLSGFVDAHTFDDLDTELTNLFTAGEYRIIIDLLNVTYISSAGVGVFLKAVCEANTHHGKVVLFGPSEDVQEVLDVLGLSELIDIAASLADALSWFRRNGAAWSVQAIPVN